MDTIHTGKIRRIAIRILTVVTAGTMACGMMPTAVLAEDTQPESSTLTIQSFSDDYTKTFEVDNGTEKDAIGLPDSLNASVQDTAADPSTDPVDTDIAVTWNCDTYDEVTAADYTFTAAVTDSKYALAEGLTMPTITVTVKAAPESADPNESGDSNDPSNDNQNNNNTRSGEPEGLPKPSINYTVQSEPTSSSWQVDKSKTATELNADNKTTVTLSLPSSDYQAVNADVVFLVDKSQYCNQDSVKTAINKMFDQLIDLQNKNPNARINIGVIRFDGWGIDAIKKEDTSGTYSGLVQLQDGTRDLIQQAMTGSATTGIGGTNTEQPVRMANAMLASDTSENTEKYVVMISDYTGYVYEGTSIIDDVSYDHVPVGSAVTVNTSAKLTPGSFVGTTVNDDYSAPYYSNWSSLYQVYANGELDSSDWSTDQIFFRSANSDYPNTKSQTNWVNYNYSGAYDTQPANKWNVITNEEYIAAAKAITQSVSAAKAKHVTGMQRSLLLTYDALQASLNDGYHLINYRVTDKDPSFTNLQIVTDMLAQIAGNGAEDYSEYNQDDISKVFDNLTSTIVYLLGSGTVTDHIAKEFSLVQGSECPFTLTVASQQLTSVSTGTNQWAFGTADDKGVYPYSVEYTPGDDEQFVWKINVPVEKSKQVQLSYALHIETEVPGTYETNAKTTLEYTDSLGYTHDPEDFTSPSVTVNGKPEPTPTSVPGPTPTSAPGPTPTAAPTSAPTASPTSAPSSAPTAEPTAAPTPWPTAASSHPDQYLVTFLDCNGNTVKVEWVNYQGSATAPAGFGNYSGYTNVSANMDLKPTGCTVNNKWVVPNTADK